MRDVLNLLKPRCWSLRNRGLSRDAGRRRVRLLLLGSLGVGFWTGAFVVIHRVLTYFHRIEGFGDVLAYKFLSMALLAFFSLLIFSGILTSLSKIYLSRDLPLVHAMPVSRQTIFLARWVESTVDSSWMVLIYSLPLFLSFGLVHKAGELYYATVGLNLLPFCLIASSLGALIVMVGAVLLPAGRVRSLFFLLSLFLVILLVTSFRLTRPERFVRPESFSSVIVYLNALESPDSALLPTTWLLDGVRAALRGSVNDVFFHSAISWSGALSLIFVLVWTSGAFYFKGLSKAQTAPGRFRSRIFSSRGVELLLRFLPGVPRSLAVKELRTFSRDQAQWSQIFLLAALMAIYLYNFSVLPLDRSAIKLEVLQNLLSFLNMGLAAFVLAAVSARFVFPAVSIEGDAFWIIQCAPVSMRIFLWVKFFVYLLPLLVLAEVLTVVTNLLLQASPFMMGVSVATVLCMVPGIVALGLGLGARYPDFRSENPAQSVTSLGGLIYMTLSLAFIAAVMVMEAGPVYSVFMSGIRATALTRLQWVWMVGSFSAVLVLCGAVVFASMRFGEKGLSGEGFSGLPG